MHEKYLLKKQKKMKVCNKKKLKTSIKKNSKWNNYITIKTKLAKYHNLYIIKS